MSDSDRKALTAQIASEEARLSELEAEQAAARQRLDALRAQLKPLHLTTATAAPAPQTNVEKVVLFRSLFRGRTDVFPRYWQNAKKGTVGYAPACANEWVRGVCEKPRVNIGQIGGSGALPVVRRDGSLYRGGWWFRPHAILREKRTSCQNYGATVPSGMVGLVAADSR